MPTRTANQKTPVQLADVFENIKTQPPLMRERVARSYHGAEGEWPLTFANAKQIRAGRAELYFNVEPHAIYLVSGAVSLRKYPQLRQLQVGAPVRVRGRIQEADTLMIRLDIEGLVFAEAAEAVR
jgi:hypothetical protein